MIRRVLPVLLLSAVTACGGGGEPWGEPVIVRIPPGSTLSQVADSLESSQIIDSADKFTLFARIRGHSASLQAGVYAFRPGMEWDEIVADLTAGKVFTERMTIPEGFTLDQIAARVAEITELDETAVLEELRRPDAAERYEVPGPGLEGYLFPDTYTLTPGLGVEEVVGAMVRQYRAVWTPERRAILDSLEFDERELVTLASIVQAEGRVAEELPIIASVYHNRLRIGMPLQADPTVLYALGGRRERLLYAAMDSVADSPYNTYTHAGLPPGPIGAPGAAAIEATLAPAETDLLYFVASPDGTHLFSRSLAEHNRARGVVDAEWARVRAEAAQREAAVRDSLARAAAADTLPDTATAVDTLSAPAGDEASERRDRS